jgi:putative iron-dependent peroxidase
MPYGSATGEKGLLFLAYSNNVDKFDLMLDRMTGIADHHLDSMMVFSR